METLLPSISANAPRGVESKLCITATSLLLSKEDSAVETPLFVIYYKLLFTKSFKLDSIGRWIAAVFRKKA